MVVERRFTGPKPFTDVHLLLPTYYALVSEHNDSMPAYGQMHALHRPCKVKASKDVNILCNRLFYLVNSGGTQILFDINPVHLSTPNLHGNPLTG